MSIEFIIIETSILAGFVGFILGLLTAGAHKIKK